MMTDEFVEVAKLMGDYEIQKREAEFKYGLYKSTKETFDKELEKYQNEYMKHLDKADELYEKISIMLAEIQIELDKPIIKEE